MTIQGGGGSKKIPPGGAPPSRPAQPEGPATPEAAHTKSPPKDVPPSGKEPLRADAFVGRDGSSVKSPTDVRLEDAFTHAASPSGIENLVRILESARSQLLAEHSKGRVEAQRCLEKLVQSGFAEAQLASTRAELFELRRRMAATRKRINQLQRRLRATFAHAGKTADANLQKVLLAQIERLKGLEPGVARSLGALQLVEQAYGSFADGSQPVLRAAVEPGTPEGSVSTLAGLAPGAVVAQALLGLVQAGVDAAAPQRELPAASPGEPAAAAGLRGFADALLTTRPRGGR